ncbi:MAG: zinc-ribbon domain-containing protein [Candidatus Eisenbacteria sp.]|nr:zinc-ribbon domain-containing protein [Candidatus Eisenbacteria bacterium]
MFFFLLVGTRPQVRLDEGAGSVQRYCPNCGRAHAFTPAERRTMLTIFFIPIFPLSRGVPCLACRRCHWCLPGEPGPLSDPARAPAGGARYCPHCGQALPEAYVTGDGTICCPHCGGRFRLV